jgi:hypothetical protein
VYHHLLHDQFNVSEPMTKPKPLPPQHELKTAFKYDPATGNLYRVHKNNRLVWCSHKGSQGYYCVKYKGVMFKASRLIWVLITGEDPGIMTIDHINRIRHDNRWCNLRLANNYLQKHNRSVMTTSTSQLKGAYKNSRPYGKPYRSSITINGVRTSLGSFDTALEAHTAYIAAGGIA